MRKAALALISVGLLVLTTACRDEPNAPKTPTVTGSWSGTTDNATLSLTLTESSDRSVSGSGHISSPSNSIALTVTGTHAHPSVSLILKATGYQDVNFQGEFSADDRIIGSLNGSGFRNDAITLRRR